LKRQTHRWRILAINFVIGGALIIIASIAPANPAGVVVSENHQEGLLVSIEDTPEHLLIGVCPQEFIKTSTTCTPLFYGSIDKLCTDYRDKRAEVKAIVNGATLGATVIVSVAFPPLAALGVFASVPFQVVKGVGSAAYSVYDTTNEYDSRCGSDRFVSEFVRLARDGRMHLIEDGLITKWSGRLAGLYPERPALTFIARPTSVPPEPISLSFIARSTTAPIDLDEQEALPALEPVHLRPPPATRR
jgi:hypothetical protein